MVLSLFAACYQPVVTAMGTPGWQRTALPHAGGVAEQDAWLMEALDHVHGVQLQLEHDRAKARARARDRDEKATVVARG